MNTACYLLGVLAISVLCVGLWAKSYTAKEVNVTVHVVSSDTTHESGSDESDDFGATFI